MSNLVEEYIERVLVYANRPAAEAEGIRRELRDHLLEKVDELGAAGRPREEAVLLALRTHGKPSEIGYRLRGGFRWVDIRSSGVARGVVAIGPRAVGVFAFGGMACGVVAVGGVACGLVSIGGLALGLLVWGGFALGGIAFGGLALAAVAMGGFAMGLVALGGLAVGAWVPAHGPSAVAHSLYTAADVPPWLKALEGALTVPQYLAGHMVFIMPIYLVALAALIALQMRERRRLTRGNDNWLVDG